MFTIDTYVSEEETVLWRELSCLHFLNREICRLSKRHRRFSSRLVTMSDGSRTMQYGLHKRLRKAVASTIRSFPFMRATEQEAYSYALSYTNLNQTIRWLWRARDKGLNQLLMERIDAVMDAMDSLLGDSLYERAEAELEIVREGFLQIPDFGC